jgi:NADPH-dependent 2,4-dienoyl-CoA reductase/sulfur reductase-like enzyme
MSPQPPDASLLGKAFLPAACDVAIVGAGPAGMAAAALATELGLDAVLLDEQIEPGGQVYRGLATASPERRAALGPDYEHGIALRASLDRSGTRYVSGASVCGVANVANRFELCVALDNEARMLNVRCVILAVGALERPLQISGWTLPGVASAGAAQLQLQMSTELPGGPTVLAGCGPLLYLVARQLCEAGANVVAILDTLSFVRFVRALPSAIEFMRSPYYARGAKLLQEINESVPIYHDVIDLAALGNDKLVSVRFTANKRTQTLIADRLVLHQGIVPEIHLADTLGCAMAWDDTAACWKPRVDAWGASSVAGVFIAGDGAGIAGTNAAAHRGALAALAVARTLGRIDTRKRDAAAVAHRQALAHSLRGRRFLDTVYRPPERFRVPRGDTIVCRCENVTAREVIAAMHEGCTGPNQLKVFLRCGMGPCQGRDCSLAVSEIVARERNAHPSTIGRFRARFPTKPLTLGQLAMLPSTLADRLAVTRMPEDE